MSALNLKRYSYICNHTYNFKRHTVLEINTNFLFFISFKITPPLFYLLIFIKRSFHLSGEMKCLLSLFLRNYKRYKYKLLPMSLVHLEAPSIYSIWKDLRPLLSTIAHQSFLGSWKTRTTFYFTSKRHRTAYDWNIYLGRSKWHKGQKSRSLKICIIMSLHISFVKNGIEKLFHGCNRTSYDISNIALKVIAPIVK